MCLLGNIVVSDRLDLLDIVPSVTGGMSVLQKYVLPHAVIINLIPLNMNLSSCIVIGKATSNMH